MMKRLMDKELVLSPRHREFSLLCSSPGEKAQRLRTYKPRIIIPANATEVAGKSNATFGFICAVQTHYAQRGKVQRSASISFRYCQNVCASFCSVWFGFVWDGLGWVGLVWAGLGWVE